MVTRETWKRLYSDQTQSKEWPELDDGLFPDSKEIEGEFWSECNKEGTILPQEKDVFRALSEIKPSEVKILVIGQDPYPTIDPIDHLPRAIGIAFAVRKGSKPPQSLVRILNAIYGPRSTEKETDLSDWRAENHVLMLNSALTVHRQLKGQNVRDVAGKHLEAWEPFIRKIIKTVEISSPNAQFVAWGQKSYLVLKNTLENSSPNRLGWCNHPMASSGERPFSKYALVKDVIPWKRQN